MSDMLFKLRPILSSSAYGFIILTPLLFPALLSAASKGPKVTLAESFQAALVKSELVKQKSEKVTQLDAKLQQLKGGIYPNLNFNVTHLMGPKPADPMAVQYSPQHQTTAALSLTQPLFRGMREWNTLDELTYLRSAQVMDQEQVKKNLFLELAGLYLQILSQEQDLRNLKEQIDLYEIRTRELSDRVRRGESARTDVVTSESTQASLMAEVQIVEGQLAANRESFAFLTGLSSGLRLSDPRLIEVAPLGKLEDYLRGVDKRPDVKAAIERWEAAKKNVEVARGSHWPSVDLNGNYYLERPGFMEDLDWDVGLKLSFPLYEGGATEARVAESVSKRLELELEVERLRRISEQEIRSLYKRLQARFKQLQSLKKSAELFRRNVGLLQNDYRRGLARNIDVQSALTEARAIQRGLDQAYFAAQLERLQLQSAANLELPLLSKE